MQRRVWIAVALTVLLAGGMLVVRWGSDEAEPGREMGRIGTAAAGSGGGGSASLGGEPLDTSPGAGPARMARPQGTSDAGVAAPARRPPPEELQRSAEGESESAGFRLGRTRTRLEQVQVRIARMEERTAELLASGETEAAERQRAVLARFERRLEELRTEEAELSAEAEREGTLDEVERGMNETAGQLSTDRPPTPAVPGGG